MLVVPPEVLDEVDELVLLEVEDDVELDEEPVEPPEVAPLEVEVDPPDVDEAPPDDELDPPEELDDEDELEDAVAFEGVSKYPARVKCALLGWMAMKSAVAEAGRIAAGQTEETAS